MLSFLSILNVPDEGFFRTGQCALNLISTFLLLFIVYVCIDRKPKMTNKYIVTTFILLHRDIYTKTNKITYLITSKLYTH